MSNNLYAQHQILKARNTGLTIYAANISKEDFTLSAIPKAIITKLSSIYMVMAERINSFNIIKHDHDNNTYVKQMLLIKQGTVMEIAKLDYKLFKDYNFPTVAGLKVNMIVASEAVADGLATIEKHLFKAIEEVENYVGYVCSNQDFRTSSRPQQPNKLLEQLVTELNANLDKCFDPKKVQDVAKFSELYPNMSCLTSIYNTLGNNGRFVNLDSMTRITTATKSLQGKIDALMVSMDERDYSISKPVLTKLSNDVENMAQLITTASSYIQWYDNTVRVFTRTLIDCSSKLSK